MTESLQFASNTEIGPYAFYGCNGLTGSIRFEPNTKIGSFAFANCTGIDVPDFTRIVKLSAFSFMNCTNLKGPIKFSDSIDQIPTGAFYNCISIESIDIRKIKIIGNESFYNCTNLTDEIHLSPDLIYIGSKAFYNTNFSEINYYAPMPPIYCSPDSFPPTEKDFVMQPLYIYNYFCGFKVSDDNETDIEINITIPRPNIDYAIVEYDEEKDDSTTLANNIEKLLTNMAALDNYSTKVLYLDATDFTFSSNLQQNEYIYLSEDDHSINFTDGNLNVMFSGYTTTNITFDEQNKYNNLTFSGNGNLNLIYNNGNQNPHVFTNNSEINGTFNLNVIPKSDVVFDSITINGNGMLNDFDGNMKIRNLTVLPYYGFIFGKVMLSENISIHQTSTLIINQQTDISNATIKYLIHSKETSNPIISGHFNNRPKKISFMKNVSPYIEKDYIIVSGWFKNSNCESWLESVDLGNSGFNEKLCVITPMNNLNAQTLNSDEVYQSLIVRSIPKKKKGLSTGAIVGIAVGSVAFVAIVVLVVILIVKCRKKHSKVSNAP